jgi:hypothetical protein
MTPRRFCRRFQRKLREAGESQSWGDQTGDGLKERMMAAAKVVARWQDLVYESGGLSGAQPTGPKDMLLAEMDVVPLCVNLLQAAPRLAMLKARSRRGRLS